MNFFTAINHHISKTNQHINKIKNGALAYCYCNRQANFHDNSLTNKRMIEFENHKMVYGEKDNFLFLYSFL